MTAPGGMCKLTLGVRSRAGASLKLTTHFQGQPFGIPSHGHADSHQRCSQTLSSGAGRWTENCLMRARVTNSDSRKKIPSKAQRKQKQKYFRFFPLWRKSLWLVYCGGCLLVFPGKSGSWTFTGVRWRGLTVSRDQLCLRRRKKKKGNYSEDITLACLDVSLSVCAFTCTKWHPQ